MKKIIFLLLVIHCSLLIANAQWQRKKIIDSVSVKNIIKDSSGYLYSLTSDYNLYKSTNNGSLWSDCTNGLNSYPEAIIATPSSILIGTNGQGIFRSTDKGQTWIQSNTGITTMYTYIESFCVKDNFVFTGTQDGMYRSSNDGISWVKINDGISLLHGISTMVSTNNYIFAETYIGAGGTMLVSTNNGKFWSTANSGLPYFSTNSLAVSGSTIFTVSEKVYQTTNYGLNWSLTPGLPYICASYVLSVSTLDNIVTVCYCHEANQNLIFISTNYGSSFYPSGTDIPSYLVSYCLITIDGLYAATPNGVYKSTNLGSNWFSVNNGFSDFDINSIISAFVCVLVGTKDHGIFRSENSGQSWYHVRNDLNVSSTCYNFLLDSYFIYSLGNYGFVFSNNYGSNWINIPIAGSPAGNLLKYYVRDQLIIGGYSGGIYKTSNLGVNWSKCESGITSKILKTNNIFVNDSIALIHLKDSNLINILYKSTNQGNNWVMVLNSGLPNNSVNLFIQDQNTFYAGTESGIYTSTNNGINWIAKNYGLTESIKSIHIKNGIIYVSTLSSGIYRSIDNALSWQPYNEGINNNAIYSIYSESSMLYAGGKGSFYIRNLQTSINHLGNDIPGNFSLYQNYPNPFNPVTKIKFDLRAGVRSQESEVKLIIYDITGREISALVNEQLQPGTYEVTFDGSNLPSGIYFYQLIAGEFTATKKLILLK